MLTISISSFLATYKFAAIIFIKFSRDIPTSLAYPFELGHAMEARSVLVASKGEGTSGLGLIQIGGPTAKQTLTSKITHKNTKSLDDAIVEL